MAGGSGGGLDRVAPVHPLGIFLFEGRLRAAFAYRRGISIRSFGIAHDGVASLLPTTAEPGVIFSSGALSAAPLPASFCSFLANRPGPRAPKTNKPTAPRALPTTREGGARRSRHPRE